MANENETIEQVCEEIRNDWACLYYSEGTRKKNGERSDVPVIETEKVADRILAAHKREILAERKLADIHIVCLLDKIGAVRAELKAKDALIEKLADALKKINDACDGDMCKHFIDTEHCSKCKYIEICQTGIAHNALETNKSELPISMAREVEE